VDGYLDPPWVHEEIQRNHASSPPSSRKKEKHHQSKEDASEQFKFVALLNCCAERRDLHEGARLHMDIIKRRFALERSPHLVSALISMYAKCGDLPSAEELLEKLPMRGTSSWNALVGGYVQQARTYEALDCFERMKNEGTPSNVVTFTCVLKACGKIGFLCKGIEIHDEIVMKGLLDKDVMLGNALVDMYARCGMVGSAQEALEMLPIRDVISWSALISGYVQKGHGHEALDCFEQMQCEGLSPNEITFVCSLKACGSIIAIETGKEIHGEVLSRGLLEKNIMLSTALVDMYAKCGMLAEAQQVHEGFLVQNTVSWSALISGYVEMGQVHETLKLFEQMQIEGITPDSVTFISILKICTECFDGAVNKGREIHSKIVTEGLLVKDILLGNALLDMYVK
jgi:pentatricopeptide repeat protein